MQAFTDLSRAAYCPRQLYYARRDDDRGPPPEVRVRRDLGFRYAELRAADDATLSVEPIDRPPDVYRRALDRLAARDDWDALVDPPARMVLLEGKDCRGVAHKLLPGAAGGRERDGESVGADAGDEDADADATPVPSIVSPGVPPERGVWEPQRVRAVAAAKALAWERGRRVPRALVEYPASGVVRTVRLTVRNTAAYRRALRVAQSLDGPPPRLRDTTRCESCAYRERCGVRTWSMRSLLGL